MVNEEQNSSLSPSEMFFIKSILSILVIGFIGIIALQSGAHYLLKSFIGEEKGIANLISVSADQRLHSQRIGLLAFLNIYAKSDETRDKVLLSLREELHQMKKKQKTLTSESELTWKVTGYSDKVVNILYQSPTMLNAKVDKFIAKANEFLEDNSNEPKRKHLLAAELTEYSTELLSGFDLLTEQFRKESIEGIANLEQRSRNIFIFETIIVILIACYVLVPLFKRLKAEFLARSDYEKRLEDKNSELTDFASIVAHDLKSPLSNVLGFNSILRDQIVSKQFDGNLEILDSIDSCAQNMNKMISDLLTYAKVAGSSDTREVISLQSIVDKILDNFKLELSSLDAKIECQNLPEIYGSRLKCEHLLQNLIGNAIKFRDKSKNLKIRLFELNSEEKLLTKIVIEDNGLGLPNIEDSDIFQPFRRSIRDQSIEGTGLGLALCKKIVEQHGGKIRAKPSENLGGACFEFTMPYFRSSSTEEVMY